MNFISEVTNSAFRSGSSSHEKKKITNKQLEKKTEEERMSDDTSDDEDQDDTDGKKDDNKDSSDTDSINSTTKGKKGKKNIKEKATDTSDDMNRNPSVSEGDSENNGTKRKIRFSMADMVHDALISLNDRKGSSIHAIRKFIQSKYYVDENFATQVKQYLTKGLRRGHVVRTATGQGIFKLSPAVIKAINTGKIKFNEIDKFCCRPSRVPFVVRRRSGIVNVGGRKTPGPQFQGRRGKPPTNKKPLSVINRRQPRKMPFLNPGGPAPKPKGIRQVLKKWAAKRSMDSTSKGGNQRVIRQANAKPTNNKQTKKSRVNYS